PAEYRQLVANLVVRRPDVIEELDLDYRLEPTCGHADGPAHDVGFRQRRVEHALAAIFHLQAGGQLEHAALALNLLLLEILFTAAVGNVFAKDDDTIVALHFVFQAGVDLVGHGLFRTLRLRRSFHLAGIEIFGIDV